MIYARARILHALGTLDGLDVAALQAAKRDWDELMTVVESNAPSVPVHDYEKLMVWLHAGATDNALGDRARAKERAEKAEVMRDRLRDKPGGHHPGLSKLMTLAYEIADTGSHEVPDLDFVTVE